MGSRRKADHDAPEAFVIVGVGASAGGLEALKLLLGSVPASANVSFLVQQHLEPNHPSHLAQLLSTASTLPVEEATDGTLVVPGRVYVAPAAATLEVRNRTLHLSPPVREPRLATIDRLFASLADDVGPRAMGVVLSGTGSDGTNGLREIQGAGGVTFAQDPRTAAYDSMPRAAQLAGVTDFVLAAEAIPAEILKVAAHPYLERRGADGEQGTDEEAGESGGMDGVFRVMRATTGVDFSVHKQSTFRRRLVRRMALQDIPNLDAYVQRLRDDPAEAWALHADALVSVTSFFRDAEAFQVLRERVLPKLTADGDRKRALRVWVAGCSTGEEVYSVAMLVLEHLGDDPRPVQVFGTDLSERNIQAARAGRYKHSITGQVPRELLERYFVSTDDGYRVTTRLRDVCVFSTHNLYQDPPFSNIDLVTCRNVLIYLKPEPQRAVLTGFHYALRPGGFLMLGPSETTGAVASSFRAVDTKNRIYARRDKEPPARHPILYPKNAAQRATPSTPERGGDEAPEHRVEQAVLAHYVPAGVVIDADGDVSRFLGSTGEFLEHRPGAATMNLYRLARPGLEVDLRTVVAEARKRGAGASLHGVRWKHGGRVRVLDLEAIPVAGGAEEQYVVTFRSQEAGRPREADEESATHDVDALQGTVRKMDEELERTRAQLQATVEQYESALEELRTANEEGLSINEELQSTNEELQTTAEELQSANEELTTLNDEFQVRNHELNVVNDDLVNLLASVRVPILFLSPDLTIRRFTPDARRVLNLIDADVGRPLGDLRPRFPTDGLADRIQAVTTSLSVHEEEVQDDEGRWHRLRIQPYRTADGRIDGTVLVLMDIDQLKSTADELRRSNRDLDNFAAFAAHEIRAPIRNVGQFLEMADDPALDADRRREMMERARRNLARVNDLVRSLLRFARVGTQEANLEPVALSRVVEAALEDAGAALREAGARVEVGDLPEVLGDPTLLTELFSNLLSNAAQYRRDEPLRVQVEAHDEGSVAHVTVRDNGVGIPAEAREKMFGLFQRGTSKGQGLGIGLAMARRIVEVHGGRIWVESTVGEGSTFHVTLARTEAPWASGRGGHGAACQASWCLVTTSHRMDGHAHSKALDVVWLEDDEEFLRFAMYVLEAGAQGIEAGLAFRPSIRHVATLGEAVREMKASPPELVITDLHVSDSRGSTTVTALREAAPATPILVLSGTEHLEPGMVAALHDAEFLDKDDLNPQRFWRAIYMAIMRTSVHPST